MTIEKPNRKKKRVGILTARSIRAVGVDGFGEASDFKMNRVTPQMRGLAQRLIAYETRGNEPSETKTPAAFHVIEKLGPHLATFMGGTGFRALLGRALALGSREVTWLRAVQLKTDGSLKGSDEIEAQVGPKEMTEGGVVLIAQLLGLLVALIGKNLTLRMAREVWPTIPQRFDFG